MNSATNPAGLLPTVTAVTSVNTRKPVQVILTGSSGWVVQVGGSDAHVMHDASPAAYASACRLASVIS